MSMNTWCFGFVPPDEVWRKNQAVWAACRAAGVDVPDSVLKFFNWEPPDPAGVQIDLAAIVRPYKADASEGFELDVKDVPAQVTMLRFVNTF